MAAESSLRYIDVGSRSLSRMTPLTNELQIGINLTDPIFRGEYHGKQRHDDDFEDVIQRGLDAGCKKFMVTGSDLEESKHAVEIAKAHRTFQP
jgi:Tat protein secretion system quality control protein TatD with DNase activity